MKSWTSANCFTNSTTLFATNSQFSSFIAILCIWGLLLVNLTTLFLFIPKAWKYFCEWSIINHGCPWLMAHVFRCQMLALLFEGGHGWSLHAQWCVELAMLKGYCKGISCCNHVILWSRDSHYGIWLNYHQTMLQKEFTLSNNHFDTMHNARCLKLVPPNIKWQWLAQYCTQWSWWPLQYDVIWSYPHHAFTMLPKPTHEDIMTTFQQIGEVGLQMMALKMLNAWSGKLDLEILARQQSKVVEAPGEVTSPTLFFTKCMSPTTTNLVNICQG